MSILSSILDWIKAVFKKLVEFIVDFIKKYWVLIAIVAIIWFAPAIGAYLGSIGAPSFITSAFTWIGATVTPVLISGLTASWAWVSAGATSAWAAFAGASLVTQAAIVIGAGVLLAPEETAELISETAELAAELITTVVGAVASGTGISSALAIGGIGLLAYWFFIGRSSDDDRQIPAEGDNNEFVV